RHLHPFHATCVAVAAVSPRCSLRAIGVSTIPSRVTNAAIDTLMTGECPPNQSCQYQPTKKRPLPYVTSGVYSEFCAFEMSIGGESSTTPFGNTRAARMSLRPGPSHATRYLPSPNPIDGC